MSKIKWTGGAGNDDDLSGNFRNGANWSGGVAPAYNDDVVLGGTGYTATFGPGDSNSLALHSLAIARGVTLLVRDHQHVGRDFVTIGASNIVNKGTIELDGGVVSGQYNDTAKSIITGVGTAFLSGVIHGSVIATQNSLPLYINSATVEGSLKGPGTAIIGTNTTIDANASITVKNLVFSSYESKDDLDLTHTMATFTIGHFDILNDHAVTLKNAAIDGGAVYNGTLVNTGHLSSAGGSLWYGTLVNNGVMELKASPYGSLSLIGTISGAGTITLDDGAVLKDEVNGSGAGGVVEHGNILDFTTNGTINFNFGTYKDFHADVRGLVGTNQFTFEDTDFSQYDREPNLKVTYSADAGGHSGTLTMTDGVDTDTFSVHLLGDYTSSGFKVTADDHAVIHLGYQSSTSAGDAMSTGSLIHV